MNLLCSWSGGKDSCYALMKMECRPTILLNALNETGENSRSHGLRKQLLKAQAKALGTRISFIEATWEDYTNSFVAKLKDLKNEHEITDAVFGDIDIQSHREWEEMVCERAAISPHLPLWKGNRRALVLEMINAGIKAMIVSCNSDLGPSFLGKIINAKTVKELEEKGVDICGENGEFHTVVLDCPIFENEIEVELGKKQNNGNGYYFLDLTVKGKG